MSKQNKDRLEEFFKKNTQNYDFEYREEDWKKLEAKLDQVDGGGAVPFWKSNGRKLILAGIILLVSLAALFFVVDTDKSTPSVSYDDKIEANASGISEEASKDTAIDQIDLENSASVNQEIDEDNNIQANEELLSATLEGDIEKKNKDQSLGINDIKRNEKEPESPGENAEGLNSDIPRKKAVGRDFSALTEGSNTESGEHPGYGTSERSSVMIPYVNPKGLASPFYSYQLYLPEWSADSETTTDLIEEEKEKQPPFSPNISLALSVAPDFSTVGIGNFTKPGRRIGGLLSYHFHERWSLRAGAILTRNIYKARGDQYNAPDGWYNGVDPIRASGNCEIVDIPINVRYNYLLTPGNTFFLTAGANSYIMLKEEYDFEYAYPQSYNMDRWESQEVSQHLFGLINISTGWEHHLAPRWSFEVEPFVNIPVSGIGWGEVDLFTFGSYFSLKYKIYRKVK